MLSFMPSMDFLAVFTIIKARGDIMASNTSAKVKNRWNGEHYDIIRFTIPKGTKETLKSAAEERGLSVAEFIREAVCVYTGWPDWPEPEENE